VETSTYGSELVASRIATEAELILEIRYMLRSLGVAFDGPAFLNSTFPSSVLKKKHKAITNNCV
jgi:hypothetical protein